VQLSSYFPFGRADRALGTQLAMVEDLFGVGAAAPKRGLRVRMQVRRRLAQLRWPWLRLPFTAFSILADPPARNGRRRSAVSANLRLRKAVTRYLPRRTGKFL
jgi:hypothetical protein